MRLNLLQSCRETKMNRKLPILATVDHGCASSIRGSSNVNMRRALAVRCLKISNDKSRTKRHRPCRHIPGFTNSCLARSNFVHALHLLDQVRAPEIVDLDPTKGRKRFARRPTSKLKQKARRKEEDRGGKRSSGG